MSNEHLPLKLRLHIEKALADIKAKNLSWFLVCEKVKWEINPNLRRTLGVAYYLRWTVEFSEAYLNGCDDAFVYNTVTHEFAHFITMFVYNDRKGHGRIWKHVHASLGGTAKRCTNAAEGGYHAKRNVVRRIILGKNGVEYRITPKRWKDQQYGLERAGYSYLRTIRVNSDNSETILHSHKEVKAAEIILDAKLNRIA